MLNGLNGLVDVDQGIISREIFVNEEIYRREQDQVFARARGSSSATRARSPGRATSSCPPWARSRSSCAAIGRGGSTSS